MVNFDSIKLLDDPPMIQVLVNLIFTDRVFNVIVFDLLGPTIVKVVYFTSYLPTIFQVVCLVDFRVPAFPKDTQNEISVF